MRVNAADFAFLDVQIAGQRSAYECDRNQSAFEDVGRAADDLKLLAADVNIAHGQFVCVGVFLDSKNFADHNLF